MAKVTHRITNEIHQLGPLIQCVLCVSEARQEILSQEKKEIPKRLEKLKGLVDTGSDSVLIDSQHIGLLKLPVRAPGTPTTTIDGRSQRIRSKCEVGLLILFEGGQKVRWDGPAHCDDKLLETSEFDLIIGRNVLASLNLHYDGPKNNFTISVELDHPA